MDPKGPLFSLPDRRWGKGRKEGRKNKSQSNLAGKTNAITLSSTFKVEVLKRNKKEGPGAPTKLTSYKIRAR